MTKSCFMLRFLIMEFKAEDNVMIGVKFGEKTIIVYKTFV